MWIYSKIRDLLDESGVADVIGEGKILVAHTGLLESTRQAIERARLIVKVCLKAKKKRSEESERPISTRWNS